MEKQVYCLNLKDVASWNADVQELFDETPEIIASIPALQRGLVWRPEQIEMLWDSLLRGFPIGSFVTSKIIDSQVRPSSRKDATHHLLDGQQRSNAIALGYRRPTAQSEVIVWLDLEMEMERDNGTKQFPIRVTNSAHPWGFRANDECSRLSSSQIRHCLQACQKPLPSEKNYRKPRPNEMVPADAVLPIPLHFLLYAEGTYSGDYWQSVFKLVEKEDSDLVWKSDELMSFLRGDSPQKDVIWQTISLLRSRELVALNTPESVFEQTRREDQSPESVETTHIEQLFIRLNRQGSELDQEELAWSLIKAQLPEIADPVECLQKKPINPAKIARFGLQIALTDTTDSTIRGALSISSIRSISRSKNPERKNAAIDFFKKKLSMVLDCVDKWLLFRGGDDFGMIPYQRVAIANSSPDAFLLIMYFASTFMDEPESRKEAIRKPLVALTWCLHLFSQAEKKEYVDRIFSETKGQDSRTSIKSIRNLLYNSQMAKILLRPERLRKYLELPRDAEQFGQWRWWESCIAGPDGMPIGDRANILWPFLEQVRKSKDLVRHCQRSYLFEQFRDYDPSDKLLFADMNVPWDYDHIMASKFSYNKKSGDYKPVVDQWIWTIGNLRAWPAEDNRSDQAELAKQKIDVQLLADSFIDSELELESFSGGDSVRYDFSSSRLFVSACRDRLTRIYGEWYSSLDMDYLLMRDGTQ